MQDGLLAVCAGQGQARVQAQTQGKEKGLIGPEPIGILSTPSISSKPKACSSCLSAAWAASLAAASMRRPEGLWAVMQTALEAARLRNRSSSSGLAASTRSTKSPLGPRTR